MITPSQQSLPPPIPPAVVASSLTPQTLAARTRGQRLGQLLRRNIELVLALLGALGLTAAQAIQGLTSVLAWGREQGLYPALAVLAIGVAAAGIRQLLAAVWGLSDRLDALAQRWEIQHHELRREVGALRAAVDTGPHAKIDPEKTPTDPRWPPI